MLDLVSKTFNTLTEAEQTEFLENRGDYTWWYLMVPDDQLQAMRDLCEGHNSQIGTVRTIDGRNVTPSGCINEPSMDYLQDFVKVLEFTLVSDSDFPQPEGV